MPQQPHRLPQKAIDEYKEIRLSEFGDDGLSDSDIEAEAHRFFNFMYLITRPLPEEIENPHIKVSEQEFKALQYIQECQWRHTTISGICAESVTAKAAEHSVSAVWI
jgi:hypothetical protein